MGSSLRPIGGSPRPSSDSSPRPGRLRNEMGSPPSTGAWQHFRTMPSGRSMGPTSTISLASWKEIGSTPPGTICDRAMVQFEASGHSGNSPPRPVGPDGANQNGDEDG